MKERPKYTVLTHFEELRRRLLIFIGSLFTLWIILFSQFKRLIPLFLMPYEKAFPELKLELVFTSLPEAIMAALKSTFFLAFSLSLPILIFQAWRFLAPALYPHEKRLFRKLLLVAFFFVLGGLTLAYFVVIPALLKFFLGLGYAYFKPLLRIQSYLSFIGKGLLVASFLSQLPLLMALLIKVEILPSSPGKKLHFYLLAVAYGVGLFISPGDLVGQLLLAAIFWGLLESGLLLARVI